MPELIRQALDSLQRNCELSSSGEIADFLVAARILQTHKDVSLLPQMLKCFRDVEAGEVQFELVEACEAYPPREYVTAFTLASGTLSKVSPYWFRLLYQSILNTPSHLLQLRELLADPMTLNGKLLLSELKALAERREKYRPILASLERPQS